MFCFYTSLDIEECQKRIDKIISNHKLVKGNVNYNNDWFHLRIDRVNVRNSFARYFYGKLISDDIGTIIKGHFHIHSFIRIFMTIWFGGIVYAARHYLLPYLGLGTSYGDSKSLFFCMLMLVFGIAIMTFGVLLGKREEKNVIILLKERLNLKELESADSTQSK